MTSKDISYEIKFVLRAENMLAGNQELKQDISGLSISESSTLDILFLDTMNFALYESGWVLRGRLKQNKKKWEMTYKKRIPVLQDNLQASLEEAELQGFDLNDPKYKIEVDWSIERKMLSISCDVDVDAPDAQKSESWRSLFLDHAPEPLLRVEGKSEEHEGNMDKASLLGSFKSRKYKGQWNSMEISLEIWSIGDESIVELSMKEKDGTVAESKAKQLKHSLQEANLLAETQTSKTQWALKRLLKSIAISELWEALRQGGYNLYFRHAQPIDTSSPDPGISPDGERLAKRLGKLLDEQNIPIQLPVSSSPLKRARETAEAAFGQRNVTIDLQLGQMDKPDLLESVPSEGFNQIMIGHYYSFGGQVEPRQLLHLGLVILKPMGQGQGFTVVHTADLKTTLSAEEIAFV
ncbi:hypothetical protein EHV15_26320 [Paenibacillus oralis]|uniref:CYTH domain-containing protein n=1 Tax=Paenibacillus oralis TaxID=2490856 RepID=A0A3P3U6P2_9BACL|nr:histidine phosphatase family protein [Paenibacillus oralis]RRJ66037.1 hypothetical protein EHV15_26320 [Paenibacillus oralis]